MVVGKFTKAKEGVILGGDFTNAVFGTVATSFNDYICAVDIGSEILILDNGDVEYYAVISKKSKKKITSNLINATTHAVISTLIPGASLAGAIAGHTAAAAAGVATGNAAAHAADLHQGRADRGGGRSFYRHVGDLRDRSGGL